MENPNRLKKFWIVGVVSGAVLAVVNFFTMGALGMIIFGRFTPLFFKIPVRISECSGEGCLGFSMLLGSILFLIFIPLLIVFGGYLYNFRQYANTKKKYIIITFVILFFLFNALTATLDYQATTYRVLPDYSSIYNKSYSSINECRTMKKAETLACYAFFAIAQDNISLCFKDELSGEIMDISRGLTIEATQCVEAYSVYKKNPEFCSKISHEDSRQHCLAMVYITKNENKNCNTLTNDSWQKTCEKHTGWNQSIYPLVQWYANVAKSLSSLI